MENKTGSKVLVNFIWRFAERTGAQLVSFVVSIILARLLSPDDYGTIALITVFTTILQVFVDSGLGTALIQKKDADDLDFSSVFYFNFIVCILLYVCMFFLAPWIARFYGNGKLTVFVRAISLTIVISGIKNIQQAYVSKYLLFKKFFFATLGGTIFSAVLGISMAYGGFGTWALIIQQLTNSTIDTLILWFTVKWYPKKMFSWKRLQGLLAYGWKLLVSSLLDSVYYNLRGLMIGKIYSASDLAYYNKGEQFPVLIVKNVNASIDSVLLPAMSDVQEERKKVKLMARKSIKMGSYIMWPLMIGLVVCAEPIVSLLLTDKWVACVPFLRIFCFVYGFHPIHTTNLNAIKAMGRSDIFLKLEIIKKIIGMGSILLTLKYGVLAMAFGVLVSDLMCLVVNVFPNRNILDYSFRSQMKDIFPYLMLAGCMGICIWPIQYLECHKIVIIIMQILTGAVVYIGSSWILHVDMFLELFKMIQKLLDVNFHKNR